MRARTAIGRFQLQEPVARSGLGMVFRALDGEGGAEVALKLIQPPEVVEPEDFEEFEREMRALSGLDHPHIARVLDWGVEEGLPYIVTEWLSGITLATRLGARGRLSEGETLDLAAQAASALAAANAAGITHRDIQPGNLLYAEATTVKVGDFAQAIFYERTADHVGIIWGRPCYVSPERLRHQPEDVRSDIYGLGAVLFHALTGTLPHDGDPHGEIMLELLETQSLRVENLVRPLHDKTATVLNRMLASERRDRFQTWEEVLAQLSLARAVVSKRDSPAPMPSGIRPAPSPKSASPAAAPLAESAAKGSWITIALLAGIVGVLGYFGWDKWMRPPAPPADTAADVAAPPALADTSTPSPAPDTPPPAPPVVAPAAPPPSPAKPAAVPAPIMTAETVPAPAPVPDAKPSTPPPPPPSDIRLPGWKPVKIEKPGSKTAVTGEANIIPVTDALRMTGNNTGIEGGHDETFFYAREMGGDWTLSAHVSSNGGFAGLSARENIDCGSIALAVALTADGKLITATRSATIAKAERPAPVPAAKNGWLKLTRRGPVLAAHYSDDGKAWREVASLPCPALPAKIPAGFVVWSGKKEPAATTFDKVKLTVGE